MDGMTCAMRASPEWDETAEQARSPKAIARGDARSAAGALTPREQQVASLISYGLTNKEIARELNISPATVKTHVYMALVKSGSCCRQGLARAATEGQTDG